MTDIKKKRTDDEIDRINRIQSDFFGELVEVFDPPLPDGVPERLDRIVASADIGQGDIVLDVGSGTGILVPIIQSYGPQKIVACDLSTKMLEHLKGQYPFVETTAGDVKDITFPDKTFDVVFVNACYPNLVDKEKSIENMARIMKLEGRLVISHPMGKAFIDILKERSPFPLDDFPNKLDAELLLRSFDLHILVFYDEPEMYLLVAKKVSYY